MEIMEKEGYKFSLLGSLMTIGLAIVTLISTFILFEVEGISIGSFQIFQITILIVSGMVIPGIIFLLSFLGEKHYLKSKNIPLIFGIVIIALSTIVIIISGIWIEYMIPYAQAFGSPLGPPITIIVCLFLAICPLLICIYGGAQNIIYWTKNK